MTFGPSSAQIDALARLSNPPSCVQDLGALQDAWRGRAAVAVEQRNRMSGRGPYAAIEGHIYGQHICFFEDAVAVSRPLSELTSPSTLPP